MAIGIWEDSRSPFEDVFKAEERGLWITVLDSRGVRLRFVGTCHTNHCHQKGEDERSLRGVDGRLQPLSGTSLPSAERSPVTESSPSGGSPSSPAKRGRLGFSRTALSVAGVVVLLGFLMWFFVFV